MSEPAVSTSAECCTRSKFSQVILGAAHRHLRYHPQKHRKLVLAALFAALFAAPLPRTLDPVSSGVLAAVLPDFDLLELREDPIDSWSDFSPETTRVCKSYSIASPLNTFSNALFSNKFFRLVSGSSNMSLEVETVG